MINNIYDLIQTIIFTFIVFVNVAFCRFAIASMFGSSMFMHKSPVFSFQIFNWHAVQKYLYILLYTNIPLYSNCAVFLLNMFSRCIV